MSDLGCRYPRTKSVMTCRICTRREWCNNRDVVASPATVLFASNAGLISDIR
ncbi:MAG: hypothetical protein HND49_03655 [Planctomycetes bacterium]|nr:hypothetical protein [Planctomycetota bacterium]